MAGIRMTGLTSGLDTQSLVGELSKAHQLKVDNLKKKQTKAEWKKEAWASLNTKIFNFYKDSLATFKSSGTYNSKKVSGSLSGVKITAGNSAVTGSHKVKVLSNASAQMWTGTQINKSQYDATSYTAVNTESADLTSIKVSDLLDSQGNNLDPVSMNGASFEVKAAGGTSATVTLSVDANATVQDLVDQMNTQLSSQGISGLTADFKNGAFTFTNTLDAGEDNKITLTAKNEKAIAIGLPYSDGGTDVSIAATDSEDVYTASAFAFEKTTTSSDVTGASKLTDLGIGEGTVISVNGQDITVDKNMTLSGLAKEMGNKGINANYDASQGRFYLSSKTSGTEFTITASNDTALEKLGLDFSTEEAKKGQIPASKAKIEYNGVEYESESGTFNINGLTIEVSASDEDLEKKTTQSFVVDMDVDGIYDKVKGFVKEYNSLITEMNKLYNAASSKGYEPLTSEEKDAMTEDEVKQWETKIKDSLLRRDSTIGTLLSSMRTTLSKSVEVTGADGSTRRYGLSSFGIDTGSYTENGQLHIAGNSEDSAYSDQEDKLKAAILADPDSVIQTFTTLGNEMYSNLQKAMKSTELSSALTFYNDKQYDSEIKNYKDDVKTLQQKLQDEEDKYYKQFSAMETAMSKFQSQQTYISQLFGGM